MQSLCCPIGRDAVTVGDRDLARFEVCAHKFVDFSEYGYGVALLNDCKYGYSVHGNVMSMSVLRAPKAPDDECDMGRHTFRYALYPHKGSFYESRVVQQAYEFNVPLLTRLSGVATRQETRMFYVDQEHVVVDTIKASAGGKKWLVRLYEAYGGRSTVTLGSDFTIKAAWHSNVLEDQLDAVRVEQGKITFDVAPFQISTFLVDLSA
jgi:alpha-mannosidase